MSQVVKCAILLEISSGASKRLPFKSDSLTQDNVVAILDEIHELLWLWMGRNTGLVMRRGSMRAARSLKAYGHEIGPSIIGRKLKDVVPIDGGKLDSDPTEKAKFDKIISLFTREHTIKADVLAEFQVEMEVIQHAYYGLSKTQRDDLVAAAIASPSAGDDSRKIEEIVGEFRPSVPSGSSTVAVAPKIVPKPAEISPPAPSVVSPPPVISPPAPNAAVLPPPVQTTQTIDIPEDLPAISTIKIPETPVAAPTVPIKDEALIGEIKASIVISAVLSEIADIFVGLKTQEGKKVFTIEGPDGLICSFSLEKSKIQFLPGSWEKIDQEKKRSIQKLFIDRVKQLVGT